MKRSFWSGPERESGMGDAESVRYRDWRISKD